jgi:hypothetical protein
MDECRNENWRLKQEVGALRNEVLRGTAHPQCMKGSVACNAIAASSGVSVTEDGTVTGLKVPL